MDLENYYGRRALASRRGMKQSGVQELPTVRVDVDNVRCYCCNHVMVKSLDILSQGKFYCPCRINLRYVSTLNKSYYIPEPNQFTVTEPVLIWGGKLSPLQ